jgi:hypothetical protein
MEKSDDKEKKFHLLARSIRSVLLVLLDRRQIDSTMQPRRASPARF